MLRSTLFLRHVALVASLVPFVVAAAGCTENVDDPIRGPSGGSGAAGAGGEAGEDGSSGGGTSGGTNGSSGSGNSGGASGSSGSGNSGGESGSSGSGNSGGESGSSGSGNSAGAAGEGGGSGSPPDTVAPTVRSNMPADEATGEGTSGEITVTFSERMSEETLTDSTFTLESEGNLVEGTLDYFHHTLSFTPDVDLEAGQIYTATVTTGAEDLAGNALELEHSWSFETANAPRQGPAPVLLGAAGDYVILAKSAIATVPTSAVTGNIGLSPAAASYITGFSMTRVGTYWTSSQVTGSIFAANNDPPTPSKLTTAVSNMQTAYTDAAGRPTPDFTNLGAGNIGGLTLTPGLYKWGSSVTIPTNVKLSGSANDVWIFQITGDLKMSAEKLMILEGGARPKNIFWQVAGAVTLGTEAHGEGIILSKTQIVLGSGASLNGRLLAQTAVNIAGSTVKAPAP